MAQIDLSLSLPPNEGRIDLSPRLSLSPTACTMADEGRRRRRRRWEDLSEDCLVEIFRRLSVEDLATAVPLVCRSWCQASLRPECWRSLNLSVLRFKDRHSAAYVGPHTVDFPGFLRFLVDRTGGSMVDLIFPDNIAHPQDLALLSDRCSGLKVLGLPMFLWVEEGCILENASKWKNLEYLYMRHKPCSFTEIVREIGSHCHKLVGLQVCGVFNYEEMAAIAASLPKLKYLCLTASDICKDGLVTILKGCRELEELHIESCEPQVDDKILQDASHIKTFKYDAPEARDDELLEPDSPKARSIWERWSYHWCGRNNDIRFQSTCNFLDTFVDSFI